VNSGEPSANDKGTILAFCHIPKAAGVTIQEVLSYRYGRAHCDTADWQLPSPDSGKLAGWVQREMRIHRHCQSVGGHSVRPWIGLEQFGYRFRWYAMVREPVERLISHYLFAYETNEQPKPAFEEWLENLAKYNVQTRFICGEQDAEKAKAIIREQFVSVGLQDCFRQSVEHLAVKEGWPYLAVPDGKRNTADRRNRDSAAARRREEVREKVAQLEPQVDQTVQEDRELYRWVREELWPEQEAELVDARNRGLVEIGPPRDEDQRRRKDHLRFRRRVFKPLVATQRAPLAAAKRGWKRYKRRLLAPTVG